MWNIFQNVHGCRRMDLEESLKRSLNSKVTEEGYPDCKAGSACCVFSNEIVT